MTPIRHHRFLAAFITGPSADADYKGVAKLFEYATATNSNIDSSPPLSVMKSGSVFDFVYTKKEPPLS